MQKKDISGFSKLSKREKLAWISANYFLNHPDFEKEMMQYWHPEKEIQQTFDDFSENTLTNFYMPYGVAPNFLINQEWYCLPMVTEESSVVAAASKSAKFWSTRGGFQVEIIDTQKIGQVHFIWHGNKKKWTSFFKYLKPILIQNAAPLTQNMLQRGGGILDIEWIDLTHEEPGYFQLKGIFETCNSMGANFINSVLENFAETLKTEVARYDDFEGTEKEVHIIMSILSNYTPNCLVKISVACPIEKLGKIENFDAQEFTRRFALGVRIAEIDPHRATTHNKGIFNGIDAVVLATGNDFRAVEADGHTYAARNGKYSSLTYFSSVNNIFKYTLEIPISLGTVGGLTTLHPLVKKSMHLLGYPDAKTLMTIAAAAGLANNFAAVKAMVTVGIQKGHMKMHLLNILKNMHASDVEISEGKKFFEHRPVSYQSVREFLNQFREHNKPTFS